MEPIILSLLHDRVAMARLATAARTVATIEGCVCAEGVRRSAAARLEVAAVILDVDVPDRRSTIPMIADLRARHPMLPDILYARVRRETVRRLLEAAKAGATDFVLRDHDDDPLSFRAVLRSAVAALPGR